MAQIIVNRAPFLTLWATVVARRLGYGKEEALALAKAFTGPASSPIPKPNIWPFPFRNRNKARRESKLNRRLG